MGEFSFIEGMTYHEQLAGVANIMQLSRSPVEFIGPKQPEEGMQRSHGLANKGFHHLSTLAVFLLRGYYSTATDTGNERKQAERQGQGGAGTVNMHHEA